MIINKLSLLLILLVAAAFFTVDIDKNFGYLMLLSMVAISFSTASVIKVSLFKLNKNKLFIE